MAQTGKSGVYLSLNDYLNNKLSYEINCSTEKHTIRLNDFLNPSFITVIHNGVKTQLYKDSIYGFISCDEPLVRFQNKQHYFLAEKGPVWIFYKNESVADGKIISTIKKYYFYTKGVAKLQELSKINLMNTFPTNHKFHDILDAEFKDGNGIELFDSFHKMLKVNHLLQQAGE
jgi:hypothetical protein